MPKDDWERARRIDAGKRAALEYATGAPPSFEWVTSELRGLDRLGWAKAEDESRREQNRAKQRATRVKSRALLARAMGTPALLVSQQSAGNQSLRGLQAKVRAQLNVPNTQFRKSWHDLQLSRSLDDLQFLTVHAQKKLEELTRQLKGLFPTANWARRRRKPLNRRRSPLPVLSLRVHAEQERQHCEMVDLYLQLCEGAKFGPGAISVIARWRRRNGRYIVEVCHLKKQALKYLEEINTLVAQLFLKCGAIGSAG